jgi:hypothetical protein
MAESPSERLRSARKPRPAPATIEEPLLAVQRGKPVRGGLWIAAAGCAFFAYAFNVAGVQGYVDHFLHGLDATLKAHNGDVVAAVTPAMPYVGAGFAVLLLLFLVYILAIGGGSSKKKKPAAKKKKTPESGSERQPDAVLIKPVRLPLP